MAVDLGLWQIREDGPRRLVASDVEFEKRLEGWIERDPSLIRPGLVIVGRQVRTVSGPLDLLAIDLQGRWVVIEIKKDNLRRETFAQAMDYAACLAEIPASDLQTVVDGYLASNGGKSLSALLSERRQTLEACLENRQVEVLLVGIGQEPALERLLRFHNSRGGIRITCVTFEVFALPSGERVLARELSETDDDVEQAGPTTAKPTPSFDQLCQAAAQSGVGDGFRKLVEAGLDAGLHSRRYSTSIMLAPPARKHRCLYTVWTSRAKNGGLWLYVATEAFQEFYGIKPEEVAEKLGDEWVELSPDRVDQFVANLKNLLPHNAQP